MILPLPLGDSFVFLGRLYAFFLFPFCSNVLCQLFCHRRFGQISAVDLNQGLLILGLKFKCSLFHGPEYNRSDTLSRELSTCILRHNHH